MKLTKEEIAQDFRKLIKPLSETFGPSGQEDEVYELIKKEIESYDVTISTDVMGNLIAFKKGNRPGKLMVAAHMDEIGLIIRHIDANGFIFIETLGGIAPQQFFGKHVVIRTEDGRHIDGIVNSLHPGRPDRCTEMPKSIGEFFIEVGAESREEVYEMGIQEGDPVSIDYPVIELGKHRVGGKALDDRALVFMLIEVIKMLQDEKDTPDFYAVFTTQEEVGARGAIVAARSIAPDMAIALDMSLATDIPGVSAQKMVNSLGKGASIKIMDKLSTCVNGLLADRKIVKEMKEICRENQITYQIEAYAAGATDASFMQTLNAGIRAGGIQIPMRYVHSYEVVDVRDVVDCVGLLYHFVKKTEI
ncbi:M42 family metallopeptidase [Oribacterium sp. WCC10]|uniref:M42 family metallopeptidase n=1 Tax=Oribacterium sp. WCC10 TaxID=1855343 RepID=UPI0008F110FD|nr:M20/M25/M40 family metallo-hydrolase [Oribacterium sp. WCC10]SFG76639.1 endoglucanase [Oribacterium sp. WCC10]